MKLVLFDIDGTVLRGGGAGKRAVTRALAEVYGSTGPSDHRFDGKTDPQIVRELMRHDGHPEAHIDWHLPRVLDRYVEVLHEELEHPDHKPRPLPGVLALLDALAARSDVVVGLLTGNVAAGARAKLTACGIDPDRFLLGAYGSDHETRGELPAIARQRARDVHGHHVTGEDIVIIGDTPADIECGRSIGVRAIGVATGHYSVAELRECGAWAAFEDLSDTAAVLDADFLTGGSVVIELELKAVVPDRAALIAKMKSAGAREVFEGRLIDRRLDFPEGVLVARDEVIRLREYVDRDGITSAMLEWKGPSSIEGGYKRREEIGTNVDDCPITALILQRLGLRVVRTIARDIHQFELGDAVIRLEHYPRMDDLVEVEGDPAAIERAIAVTGLPRDGFSTASLSEFALRFEMRTGQKALTGRFDDEAAPNA